MTTLAPIEAKRPRSPSVVAVVLTASIATMTSFAVAAGYSLHEVDGDERPFASTVARDVGAIAQLTVLRADLERIEELLAESTDGHPWEPGALRRLLESVDRETAFVRTAYAASVDQRLRAAAFDALAQARAGIGGLRAALDTGDVDRARREMHGSMRPRLRQADSALAMLLQSSMDELSVAVSARSEARRSATQVALALDALCVGVALLFGALAFDAVRREQRRLRAHVAELEIFADRVAHDIRGPLTPVRLAMTEALRGATDPGRASLERGVRSLRVLTEIVDGLHGFARSDERSPAEAHATIRDVLADVVEDVRPEAAQGDVQLAVLGVEDADVACARGVLASIASNLLRNAIRHMDRSVVRRVTLSAHTSDRSSVLVVQDTGPGMPPGFEEQAFLPYARPEGSPRLGLGLGLATVKRLADAHGGSVTLESTPRGCTFVVELPLWNGPRGAPIEEPVHAQ